MADALNIKPAPNWGGIPYAQGTTFGQPLSPYANWTDQLYAALQPMPTGVQFNRWNFGQQPPPMQQGMSPPGVSGLLGGAGGQPMPGAPGAGAGVGAMAGGGGYPSGSQTAPAGPMQNIMNPASFGQPTNTGNAIQNPSQPWQQAFNQILAKDPAAAWSYLYNVSGARPSDILSMQLGQGMTGTQINQLANNYARGASQTAQGATPYNQFVAQNPGMAGPTFDIKQYLAANPQLLGRRAGTRGLLGG